MGDLPGCPKYDLISFIKHRVNTKMSDLGYGAIVNGIDQDAVKRMKWFDSLSGKQHTDFFANRVTNYRKIGTTHRFLCKSLTFNEMVLISRRSFKYYTFS